MKRRLSELVTKVSAPADMMRYRVLADISEHLSYLLEYFYKNIDGIDSRSNNTYKLIGLLYNSAWISIEANDTDSVLVRPFKNFFDVKSSEFKDKWGSIERFLFVTNMEYERKLNANKEILPNFVIREIDKFIIDSLVDFKTITTKGLLSEDKAKELIDEFSSKLPNDEIFDLNETVYTVLRKDGTVAPPISFYKDGKQLKVFKILLQHWKDHTNDPILYTSIMKMTGLTLGEMMSAKSKIELKFRGAGIDNAISINSSGYGNGAYIVSFFRP